MGNGTGKIIGIVAGAACCAIPGVGQVAGAAILLGTVAAGSGVDAIVDSNNQNSQADKAAEEAKRKAAEEVERQRVVARKNLEDQAKIAREAAAKKEIEIEKKRKEVVNEAKRQQELLRNEQEQLSLVNNGLEEVAAKRLEKIPGLIQRMNDVHFELFRQGVFATCNDADDLEECQMIIEHEELRRDVLNGWNNDINKAASNNDSTFRPSM